MGGWLQSVWPSSDWLVVRWQGGVLGISISLLVPTNLGSRFLRPPWIYHPPDLGGSLVPVEDLKRPVSDSYVYSLRRKLHPAPWLHYCFLTAFPLFLHFLSPLISNYLNLPFGTQWGGWNLFPTNKKWGAWKGFWTWEIPTGSCSISVPRFLWYSSVLRGTKVLDKKRNNIFDREVKNKLPRGTWC